MEAQLSALFTPTVKTAGAYDRVTAYAWKALAGTQMLQAGTGRDYGRRQRGRCSPSPDRTLG